jgi:flagellar basal body-associated protein FliL
MKKKLLIIVGVVIALGVIGAGVGLYLFFKPTKDFAKSKADFTVTAEQLFTEFSKNETASSAKYVSNDKTIELSGTVQSITDNSDSTKTIILAAGSPDGDISCTLTKGQSATAKVVEKQSITLKGQCTGLQELIAKEVILIRCAIAQ